MMRHTRKIFYWHLFQIQVFQIKGASQGCGRYEE